MQFHFVSEHHLGRGIVELFREMLPFLGIAVGARSIANDGERRP